MEPEYFNDAAKAIYDQALKATVELFKANGEKRYVIFDSDENCSPVWAISVDDVPLFIYGIGLDEKDELVVVGCVLNIGYGYSGHEFPSDWTAVVSNIRTYFYPDLYRFAAENIDSAMTRAETDEIKESLFEYLGDDEDEDAIDLESFYED